MRFRGMWRATMALLSSARSRPDSTGRICIGERQKVSIDVRTRSSCLLVNASKLIGKEAAIASRLVLGLLHAEQERIYFLNLLQRGVSAVCEIPTQ
jgi:hypothetical protein